MGGEATPGPAPGKAAGLAVDSHCGHPDRGHITSPHAPGETVRLEFSGAPEIAAPPEVVWTRLLDHKFVASIALEIEPVAPGRCRLKWNATSEVRGTVASVGARLLKGTAQKLTENFWDEFAARVGAGGGGGAGGRPHAPLDSGI